jgi:hypothetical protein
MLSPAVTELVIGPREAIVRGPKCPDPRETTASSKNGALKIRTMQVFVVEKWDPLIRTGTH